MGPQLNLISGVDHVQLAAPPGCEADARQFYGEVLGMTEITKPVALQHRGGCWFQCDHQQVHIGVEQDFRPAKKAHPAFLSPDLDKLEKVFTACHISYERDSSIAGVRRIYANDPWGNRLEFIEI
jgi:catechol 2,3-dioxygenase-like lactoylglutathione lyase family enzyme